MRISPARTSAFDILIKIETEHLYSSALLAQYESKLSALDRGLCHELVLGVLRRKLLLDRYIDIFTSGKKLDIEIRVALQLGIFQLYYLDRVPDHAAVNESVGLTQRAKKSSASGLVNAILRASIRQKPLLEFKNEIERIAIETSHPEWLIERWKNELGAGLVESLAHSNNEVPPITFRKTIKGSGVHLPTTAVESTLVPGCFIADSFDAQLRQLADEGQIYFQDEASQMVAAAVGIQSGDKFLDLCASPGGKTTYIACQISYNSDSLLVAGDLTHRRVKLLQETCGKQGANSVNIVRYDGAALPFADNSFDRILVDAPCSGTGTIRHNPELRYFIKPDDVLRMKKTQSAILSDAARLVKPNGILIYSTCSLEREENEDVCMDFLSASPGWTLVRSRVQDRFITSEGFARTFPHRDGLDGFFIATFQRM